MDKFIQPSHDDFVQRRPNHPFTSHVTSKIETLLSLYACFDNNKRQIGTKSRTSAPIHVRPNATNMTFVKGAERWKRKEEDITNRTERKRVIGSGETQEHLDMKSLLNKITNNNYGPILKKITQIIEKSSARGWVMCLFLQKCYTQSFFADVYLNLINDFVGMTLEPHEVSDMSRQLADFADETMSFPLHSRLPSVKSMVGQQVQDYDSFCERGKIKREMLGRARTVIGLIDRKLVSITRLDFMYKVIRVTNSLFDASCLQSVIVDDHVDVALEYIRIIVEAMPLSERAPQLRTMIVQIHDILEQSSCSRMCKFKMQGVLESAWCDLVLEPVLDLEPKPDPCLIDLDGADLWTTTAMLRQHLRLRENTSHLRGSESRPRRVVGQVVSKSRAF